MKKRTDFFAIMVELEDQFLKQPDAVFSKLETVLENSKNENILTEKASKLSTEDRNEIFDKIFSSDLSWEVYNNKTEATTKITHKNEEIPVILYCVAGFEDMGCAPGIYKSFYCCLYYKNGPTTNDADSRVKELVSKIFGGK